MGEYPRVLHVGFNRIGSPSNAGVTLGSMFGAWPDEFLFELYLPSRQTGARSANVAMAPAHVAPIDHLARHLLGARLPAPVADGLNNSVSRRGGNFSRRTHARVAMSTLNDIGPVLARGRWLEQIRNFRPQVIHSLLGGVRVTKLVGALSRELDVPVVPHFMDDWHRHLFADGRMLGLPRRAVERSLRHVMSHAPVCLAIGEDMVAEFEDRTRRPYRIVGNSVDFALYSALASRPIARDGPLVLRYIGGLHLGRVEPLDAVVQAIGRRPSSEVSAVMVLHVPVADQATVARLVAAHPGVVQAGVTLDPQQVPEALTGSDVLVFVESFRPEIANFTNLSVSTKVPEYLAARRPVLAVGPREQSSVRQLLRGPATWWAPDSDHHALDQALDTCLTAARGTIGSVDHALVDIFDTSFTRERLRSALNEAAKR